MAFATIPVANAVPAALPPAPASSGNFGGLLGVLQQGAEIWLQTERIDAERDLKMFELEKTAQVEKRAQDPAVAAAAPENGIMGLSPGALGMIGLGVGVVAVVILLARK